MREGREGEGGGGTDGDGDGAVKEAEQAGADYVGAPVWDLWTMLRDLDPLGELGAVVLDEVDVALSRARLVHDALHVELRDVMKDLGLAKKLD